jgi:hypothetical protein
MTDSDANQAQRAVFDRWSLGLSGKGGQSYGR